MKDLNLIPKSYFLKKKKKVKMIVNGLVALLILAFMAMSVITPLYIKGDYKAKKDEAEKRASETSSFAGALTQFNVIKDQYNKRESEQKRLRQFGFDMAGVFERIEKALPEKLFIVNFSASLEKLNEANISIDCAAASEEDIASFINILRKDGYFKSVTVPSVKKSSQKEPGAPAVVAGKNNTAVKTSGGTYYSFSVNLYLENGK